MSKTKADIANEQYEQRIRDVTTQEISELPETCNKRGGYLCYVLRSVTARMRTYAGCSCDLPHRLRQHNGLITGGARATLSSRPWRVACVVTGFVSRHAALRYEYFTKVKHSKRAFEAAKKKGSNSIQRRAVLLREAERRMDPEETLKIVYHTPDPYLRECLESTPVEQQAAILDTFTKTKKSIV